jgi:hypothetical protein
VLCDALLRSLVLFVRILVDRMHSFQIAASCFESKVP